jgi:hypothetical protein
MKTRKAGYTFALTCLVLVGLSTVSIPAQTPSQNVPSFQGPPVEDFLKGGKVTRLRDIGQGVTLPQRATLELEGRQHDAVFKTIDEYSKVKQLDRGLELEFQDSWKTEIAAYELDKLLGLGMVPATVERSFGGKKGSMQYWIDSKMSEAERIEKKLRPPSQLDWEEQVTRIRMFDNLIYNTDRHLNNLRITEDWKIRLIDHSRTFRPFEQLKDPKLLTRFSRALLEKIEQLNEPVLKEKLGNYLTPYQIQGLLKRRTAMLELSKKLVAEKGAGAVLYR